MNRAWSSEPSCPSSHRHLYWAGVCLVNTEDLDRDAGLENASTVNNNHCDPYVILEESCCEPKTLTISSNLQLLHVQFFPRPAGKGFFSDPGSLKPGRSPSKPWYFSPSQRAFDQLLRRAKRRLTDFLLFIPPPSGWCQVEHSILASGQVAEREPLDSRSSPTTYEV